MSYQLTYGILVQKQLQYIEGAAGTYATFPSSPTLASVGPVREMTDAVEMESINYRMIGSRDRYQEIRTGSMYSFSLTYNPVDENLMKYGINLPAGAGTMERDLQLVKSQLIDGTEKYQLYKGFRPNTTEISITNDSAVEVTQEFIGSIITDWSSTHGIPGTPTFAANPTAAPWTNLTGGSQPLRFNGVALDTPSFSCSINTNLTRVKPNGETEAKWIDPTFRDITFEFDIYERGSAERADMVALTPRELIYHLTNNKQLRFTGAVLKSMDESDNAESSDPKMRSYSGTATTCVIETY